MNELPTIPIKIFQYEGELRVLHIMNCLLDTGATHNLLNHEKFINSCIKITPLDQNLNLENAVESAAAQITHQCIVNIQISKNLELEGQTFLLVPNLKYDAILGMPALEGRKLRITRNRTIICNNFMFQNKLNPFTTLYLTSQAKTEPDDIIADENVILSPLDEVYIKIRKIQDLFPNQDVPLTINTSEDLMKFGCLINPVFEKDRKSCKIKNHSNNVIVIEENSKLGFVSRSTVSSPVCSNLISQFLKPKIIDQNPVSNLLVASNKISKDDLRVHNKELEKWRANRNKLVEEVNLSREIDRQVKNTEIKYHSGLRKLLMKHDWSFSRNPNDSGMNQKWLISLELKPSDNGEPSFTRPYRISDPNLSKELDSKIKNMEKFGILQKTTSPWNSPILTVKKKSGGLRVVNNFSANVNKRLICSHFPISPLRVILRKFSEIIARLKRNYPDEEILISAIDFRNGYYVLSIRESQRDITAFICNSVQMRYARLSQGLSLAPSAFQRFLDICFGNLEEDYFSILSYLDDYLLISPASRHVEALDKFFTKCREENIIIALEKCELLSNKVEFLGYIISASGISVKKNKLDNLKKIPYPDTRKRAQAFLGCFNYFTRSVPRLSFYLKPICTAISGDKKYVLTDIMKKSIDILRSKLDSLLTLHHLDLSDEGNNVVFIVSDASLTHAGFAIGNADREGDKLSNFKISAFGSQVFDQVTCDLPSRSRELIALSYALEYFSDLIPVSHPITAIVDHKSLTNVQTQVNLGKGSYHTRIRNAYAIIFNYSNLSLVYSPGDSDILKIADGLSRVFPSEIRPIDKFSLREENNVKLNNFIVTSTQLDREKVKAHQKQDEYCKQIVNNIGSQNDFVVENELLFKKLNGKLLCVIPESLAMDIINFLHIQSMHRGLKAIRRLIHRSNIYIRNMTKLSHFVLTRCLWCQFHTKKYKSKQDQQIVHKPSFMPFQAVCLDLMEFTFATKTIYLLTFLDLFSLFLDSEVIYSKSAEVVSSAILRLAIKYNCGFRSTFITDNGREFKNNQLKIMLNQLGIVQNFTSPYNSRANRIERSHRELRYNLKVLEPNGLTFGHKISLAISAWNNTPQKGLGFKSPAEIIFGFQPLNHLGFLQPKSYEICQPDDVPIEEYDNRINFINEVHQQQSFRNMVKYEESSFDSPQIREGDLVLVHDPKITFGTESARQDNGPYIVIRIILRTAKLRHILTNFETIRNVRFIQKLHLTSKDKENILAQNAKMMKEHKILTLPEIQDVIQPLIKENKKPQSENPRRSDRIKAMSNKSQNEDKSGNRDENDSNRRHQNRKMRGQKRSNDTEKVYKEPNLRRSLRIKNRK